MTSREQIIDTLPRVAVAQQRWEMPQPFPRFLYKYTRFEPSTGHRALRGLLCENSIWMASPLSFNDPFDMRADVGLSRDVRKARRYLVDVHLKDGKSRIEAERGASELLASGLWKQRLTQAFTNQCGTLGVACFSRVPRNILMWSHYADQHRGVCLQFHTLRSAAFFSQTWEVGYEREVVRVDWSSEVDRRMGLMAALTTKFEPWAYEQEWRAIRNNSANTLHPLQPNCLTAVILGFKADDTACSMLVELLRDRRSKGHASPRVFRAHERAAAYGVCLRRANDVESRLAADRD